MTTISRYPLQWPHGWRRTPESHRKPGQFGRFQQVAGRNYESKQPLTTFQAIERLMTELEAMGIHKDDVVISTNLPTRLDGLPRSDARAPTDPGAAVYWVDPGMGNQPRCMAIDVYTRVEMNIAALAATIQAMRQIERHGGALVLARAFTGFVALPAPIAAGMKRDWWDVLGVEPTATAQQIQQAYRRLASQEHPDRNGSQAAMAALNVARDEAMEAQPK